MKKSASLLLFVFLCFPLLSQDLAGRYFATGNRSLISLKLENTIGGVQGMFRDMQGVLYQLQGEVQYGEAFGTLASELGYLYFKAFRQGPRLYFTLIPLDGDGQPDPTKAQEVILMAEGYSDNDGAATQNLNSQSHNAAGGQVGGPLGGQMSVYKGNWNGEFKGNINGMATIMTVKMIGNHIEGPVDAGGYQYSLDGIIYGNESKGKLRDPQTQGYFNFTATLNGDQMNMTIENPTSGQSHLVVLNRGAGDPVPTESNIPNGQVGQQYERDSRLVGSWNYTESYTSGSYSFATQWKLIINQDGTYIYGDGRVVGGGPGVSGDSGSGGDIIRGQWRTINNVIHINTGPGWQPYARYTTDGQSILMQFGDGNKQLWKRSY